MRPYATIALVGSLLVATPLSAQICGGTASFAAGAARVGAGASFTGDYSGYTAGLALGQPIGPFGSLNVERDSDKSTAVGVSLGYAIESKSKKNVQFCPRVDFAHAFIPDIESPLLGTVQVSANMLGLGASVGGTTALSPTADFIPFGSAMFVVSRGTSDFGTNSVTTSTEYLALGVGAGFVLNRTWTILPAVSVPLGLEGGTATWTIAFALNLGSATRSR